MWERQYLPNKQPEKGSENPGSTSQKVAGSDKAKRKDVEKEEEEKEEKSEAQQKSLVDKAQRTNLQRTICELPCVGKERRRFGEKMQREEKESQDETISGKIWKMVLPSLDSGAELGLCRCASREAGARR